MKMTKKNVEIENVKVLLRTNSKPKIILSKNNIEYGNCKIFMDYRDYDKILAVRFNDKKLHTFVSLMVDVEYFKNSQNETFAKIGEYYGLFRNMVLKKNFSPINIAKIRQLERENNISYIIPFKISNLL